MPRTMYHVTDVFLGHRFLGFFPHECLKLVTLKVEAVQPSCKLVIAGQAKLTKPNSLLYYTMGDRDDG